MSHRAAFAAIGLAAAIGAAPAQGAAQLNYQCKWPIVGTQPVSVTLSANLPQNLPVGSVTPAAPVSATLRLGGNTAAGFALTNLKTLSGVSEAEAPGKGAAFRSRASLPDGSGINLRTPLDIEDSTQQSPPLDPLPLYADGTLPSLTLDVPGTTRFDATELILNLKARDADGNPVPGFRTPRLPGEEIEDPDQLPRADIDGNPDTFNVACQLDASSSTTEFARVAVSQAPTIPAGVKAENVTATSVDLSWNASSDPDGTVAEYRVTAGDQSVTTTGTSIKLENLAPDSFYFVRVFAIDNDGAFSPYSDVVSFRTKRVNGDAQLDYRCKFPLAGTSYVSLDVDTDLPATWQTGKPTPAGPVSAKLDLDVYGTAQQLGPETGPFRMESVTDAEKPGKGSALGLAAGFADGTSAGVRIPLGAAPYEQQLPSWEYLALDFTGSAPPIVFPAAGTSTFDATSLTLNLRAVRPDGTPVPGFVTPPTDIARNPYEDIDGDPTTANVPCVLEPQISQRLATTEVTPGTTPGPINYAYDLKGSTQIKTLTKGTLPLSGSIAAQLTLATGAFTADLQLSDTSGRLVAAGFLPVTAKIGFAPSGKTTGTLIDGVLKTNSKVRIKVKEIKLFGAIPLAGGNNCQTRSLSDINLQSTQAEFSPLVGGPIAGTYKISDLNGCGALNGLVSPLTAGAGNTIALNLTPKS